MRRARRLGHYRPPRLRRFKLRPLGQLELRPLPNAIPELPEIKFDELLKLDPHPGLTSRVFKR